MHDMGTCACHPSATAQVCTPTGHQTVVDHGPSHTEAYESLSVEGRKRVYFKRLCKLFSV